MSELRAPDPTLTALGDASVAVRWDQGPVPVAHTLSAYPDGDPPELVQAWPTCDLDMEHDNWSDLPAESSAWFAMPCRACFPDAPPPGHSWTCRDCDIEGCSGHYALSFLAWQVPA